MNKRSEYCLLLSPAGESLACCKHVRGSPAQPGGVGPECLLSSADSLPLVNIHSRVNNYTTKDLYRPSKYSRADEYLPLHWSDSALLSSPMSDLSTAEVARRKNVSVHTVRWWCRNGHLPNAYEVEESRGPVWKIPESDLDTFERPRRTGRPPAKKAKGGRKK